jgi:hypothetical protein
VRGDGEEMGERAIKLQCKSKWLEGGIEWVRLQCGSKENLARLWGSLWAKFIVRNSHFPESAPLCSSHWLGASESWCAKVHFFFFLAVVWFELRALASYLSLELCPQSFFALVVFLIGSCGFSQDWPQTMILIPVAPCNWDHRHASSCLGYWLRTGVFCTFLSGLTSNHDPPDLCLLSSWNYWCVPPCLAQGHIFTITGPLLLIPDICIQLLLNIFTWSCLKEISDYPFKTIFSTLQLFGSPILLKTNFIFLVHGVQNWCLSQSILRASENFIYTAFIIYPNSSHFPWLCCLVNLISDLDYSKRSSLPQVSFVINIEISDF